MLLVKAKSCLGPAHLRLRTLPSKRWASSWVNNTLRKRLVSAGVGRGLAGSSTLHRPYGLQTWLLQGSLGSSPSFPQAYNPPIAPGFEANQKQGQDGLGSLQLDFLWGLDMTGYLAPKKAQDSSPVEGQVWQCTKPGQDLQCHSGEVGEHCSKKGKSNLRL